MASTVASTILASSPLSASAYIGGGLLVLFSILVAETGLLIGFFLPGDTLLLLAGDYTNQGRPHHLGFLATAGTGVAGAVIGAQLGFLIGRRVGPPLFASPARQQRLARAHRLLDRLGQRRSVVGARFVPVVRTVMNPALGLTGMPTASFAVWNIVGALLWVPLVLLIGRAVGSSFPLDKIVVGVVVVSLAAGILTALRERRRSRN